MQFWDIFEILPFSTIYTGFCSPFNPNSIQVKILFPILFYFFGCTRGFFFSLTSIQIWWVEKKYAYFVQLFCLLLQYQSILPIFSGFFSVFRMFWSSDFLNKNLVLVLFSTKTIKGLMAHICIKKSTLQFRVDFNSCPSFKCF